MTNETPKDRAMNKARSRAWRSALSLGILAALLYVPLIGWGLPHATAPDRVQTFAVDELLPLGPLAEMHNTFVVSKPDRNYGYPWWHYFVLAGAQAPYLAYLKFTGGWDRPETAFPFGLRNPVRALKALTLIGRAVSVLMGAGVVVAAYWFSFILWGHAAGVVTALLTMLNYLMFYFSRTGNTDVPAFFWTALGLVVFARIFRQGLTARRAIWLGIFTGVAIATKDQAVAFFLPLGVALLFRRFHGFAPPAFPFRPLLLGLAASLVAYGICTGMVVDPARHVTHVKYLFFNTERLTSMPFYHPPYPRTLAGFLDLFVALGGAMRQSFTLPVLMAAAAGLVLALKNSRAWLVFLLPLVLNIFLLNILTGVVVVRYFLPFTLLVDAFAAYAVISLRNTRWKLGWVAVLVVLCAWRLALGMDLTYAQWNETRYAASAWLQSNMRPGERIEFFGNQQFMPPLPAEIPSRRIAGRKVWTRESGHGPYLLEYLHREGPEYLAVFPDQTSRPGADFSGDCPPEVYAALVDGSAGYRLAADFPASRLLRGMFQRPALDNPSVSPPVRIFARVRPSPAGAGGVAVGPGV